MKLVERFLMTPEKAREILDSQNEKRLYRLPQTQSARYGAMVNAIKDGRWRWPSDPIVINTRGDVEDGITRLTAIVEANTTVYVVLLLEAEP